MTYSSSRNWSGGSPWKRSKPEGTIWYGGKGWVTDNPKDWPRCRNGAPFCQSGEYIHCREYLGEIHDLFTVNYIQYRRFWVQNGHIIIACRECWRHIKYQRIFDIMSERIDLDVPYHRK